MPSAPKQFSISGPLTKTQNERRYDQQRGTAAQRGPYNTAWWKRTRRRIAVRDNYHCKGCGVLVGYAIGDYHCDHIKERPMNARINTDDWDADTNLRTLCPACHNKRKATG